MEMNSNIGSNRSSQAASLARLVGRDQRRLWLSVAGVVGFAVLTAVSARLAIPLPGTPVPLTLQTLFAVLAGITLGPTLGAASMAFYLLLGITGYNVFAVSVFEGGRFIGPTAGYLIGFVLAQPIVGCLAQRRMSGSRAPTRRNWMDVCVAAILGHAVIFGAGLIWLATYMQTDLSRTLEMGLWPFLTGTIVKTAFAAGVGGLLLPRARRALGGR